MRALLLLLLFTAPILAQGGGRKPPVFDIPEDEKPSDDGDRPDPDRALRETMARLAGWPAERSRRAAERLMVQKEKSLPLILEILVSADSRHAALKPGAAYVLGRIGEKSHFLTLVLVAAEEEQHRHAATFLEAAYRLNPDAAVEEAFRFFHLSATTLRHEATKFVRKRITKRNLEQVLELIDRQSAERAFTREIGLRLLDRLVESREVSWEDASPRLYRALGDESPRVAAAAMKLVASRNDEGNIKALNELITKKFSYWRQRSYAAMALTILSSAFKLQPFEPETIEVLKGERGIQHPKELLVQASAALALAQAALRGGDKELVRLLDRTIPIVLIESVGAGNHHYRDFASVMPVSYTMLRRITGETLPDHAPRWAQWWRDHGHRFRARRELIEVEPEDWGDVVVEVHRPKREGGEAIRLAAVGKNRPTFRHGRAYALPQEDLGALVGALREQGFFDSPEADPARLEHDEAMVVVRVGDLVRTVSFGPGSSRDRIRERVEAAVANYGWQLWWDIEAHPSWELFFGENRRWFGEHAGEAERAARLRAMISSGLQYVITPAERLHAVRTVASLPGGGKALSEEQVGKFIEAVASERQANEFVAHVVELLVPEAGEKATDGLVDALAAKVGPRAQALLVQLCSTLPFERVAMLAGDPRWKVRRAAVGALAAFDSERSKPVLKERLKDAEVLVRVVAAEALARARDRSTLPALAALSEDRSDEVRAAAAFAYGLLGSSGGLEPVRKLLYSDPSPIVRTRAIDGLVEGKDPAAPGLLVGVLERESDVRVRAAAAGGVVSMETPELVDSLMTRLEHTPSASPERVALVNVLARFQSDKPVGLLSAVLRGDDTVSADAAAIGLARRWDPNAVVQLIRMVERGRNARLAVRHLQILSSRAFEAESYMRQAENYKGWYKTNSTGNPRAWFRDALTERGYDTTVLAALADSDEVDAPGVPDEAVPLLLRTLRDEDWFIRRNASFLLRRRIGPGAPDVISYLSSEEEAERAIRAFNDWWADETERREKDRRG